MKPLYILLTFFLLIPVSKASSLDVESLKPGEMRELIWKDRYPVIVYRRTTGQVEALKSQDAKPEDPSILRAALVAAARTYDNKHASMLMHGIKGIEHKGTRSKKDEILVVLAISSYFGCYLKPELDREIFVDPCSNAEYGLDGRLRKANRREFYHLFVPPHYYKGSLLVIGLEQDRAIEVVDFSPDIIKLNISNAEKLLEAIQWKKTDLALSLLANEDTHGYQTKTGATAMHVAATRGNPEIIDALFNAGFDVNQVSSNGVTPLHLALMAKYDDNAVALIKRGALIDAYCIKNRCAEAALDFLKTSFPSASINELKNYLSGLQESAH